MTATPSAFPIRLELKKRLPETVDVAAIFKLALVVETDSGCDLTGIPFLIEDGGAVVASGVLPTVRRLTRDSEEYDPRHGPVDLRDSAEIAILAPAGIGSYQWTLRLPEAAVGGVAHQAAALTFQFATGAHSTSLAVWDNPTPVTLGAPFSLKVGAKCSAGCCLTGETIEILDAEGRVVGAGVLGEAVWPGTTSLYWASISVEGPVGEGPCRWSVRMASPPQELPHGSAAAVSFSSVATRPAEHKVSIAVVEQETGKPVARAQVRLGAFRAVTNDAGAVTLELPSGDFTLRVFKENYDAPEQSLAVKDDLEVLVSARALPIEEPYSRYWKT